MLRHDRLRSWIGADVGKRVGVESFGGLESGDGDDGI